MNRFGILLVVALVVCVASSANAAIFAPNGQITGLDYKNYENLENDVDGDGKLDVGDTLRGVVQLQNTSIGINGSVLADLLEGNAAGNPEITGIFEVEVLYKHSVGGDIYNYVFGPHAGFATEFGLPTDTMIAFWTDPTFEYTATVDDTAKTAGDVESVISDGSAWLAAGLSTSRLDSADVFNPASLDATGDGYWYATNADEDVVPGAGSFGTANFYYGLNVLPGFGLDSSLFIPLTNTQQVVGGLSSDLNTFVGKGSASPNVAGSGNTPGSIDKFDINSNDPAGVKVVPEPASMAVWSLLSLGGLALARRRRKNA